jgi:plasmid stabilization system protein ParE
MAGQIPSGPDNQRMEALAKQLADLERQTAELGAALQRSASVRMLLTLVVLALLLTYGYLFYTKGKAFTQQDNLDRLTAALELSAQRNSTEILNHVEALYKNTSPTISAAFAEQLKQDMPKLTHLLGAERETLAINLQGRLEGLVQGHYNKALDQHRSILIETFPSVKDERDLEAMTDNFKDAFRPLVKQHYGDKIRAEFEKMFKTWDTFPLDDSKRTREELSQELYQLLFALMQEKLAAADEEQTGSRPTPGASGS